MVNFCYIYKKLFVMMKQKEEILYAIKEVIAQVMPTGARVVLLVLRLVTMPARIRIGIY